MDQRNKKMKDCTEDCLECFEVCTQTIPQCLEKGGDHANPKHIALLQVCADLCRLSASAMLLESEQHSFICEACAKVCLECAEECEAMDGEFMKECAEVCRKCASSCEDMSSSKKSNVYGSSQEAEILY